MARAISVKAPFEAAGSANGWFCTWALALWSFPSPEASCVFYVTAEGERLWGEYTEEYGVRTALCDFNSFGPKKFENLTVFGVV